MDSEFFRKVLGQVRKRMKTFEVPGCRESRRIQGMFNRDDEIYGFKHLCIYVDAGLVGREQQIATILGTIDCQIYSHEHYDHTRWLMFFGIEPDRFVTPGPIRVYQGIRISDWAGMLKKYISAESTPGPLIIPRPHSSEVARIRCPDRYDLGLFFCRSKEVCVRTEAEQRRFRQIGSRYIWIFFDEEETPQMDTGGFVPQVIPDCNMMG